MPSLGETFREARKRKGISEEVAAKAIKIKVERLRDLEENRYDQFPAHVYVRSFLKHYAEYLGMDSEAVVQQFVQEYPQPETKPIFEIIEEHRFHCPIHRHVPASTPALSLTATGRTILLASIIVIPVVAACFWWIFRASRLDRQPLPKPPAAGTTAVPSGNMDGTGDVSFPSLSLGTNSPPSRTGP